MPRLSYLDQATGLPVRQPKPVLYEHQHPGDLVHVDINDHSRLAYSEILTDEKKDTAAGFWPRAREFFAGHGIAVLRALTDNGFCYRSHAFAQALGPGIKHKFTRPYRPQTNGKVERFSRTLATELAYAQPYKSDETRIADYDAWLHHYKHHRPPYRDRGPLTYRTRS